MAADDQSGNKQSERISNIVALVMTVAIAASAVVPRFVTAGKPDLDVVTAVVRENNELKVSGRVHREGVPIAGAEVWGIAANEAGNRVASDVQRVGADGAFAFSFDEGRLVSPAQQQIAIELTIFAKYTTEKKEVLKGSDTLSIGRRASTRWAQISPWAIVTIPAILAASIVVAIPGITAGSHGTKLRYYGLIVLAAAFTFTMLVYISVGLRYVNASASKGDVIALGFANIFYGTYVKDVDEEWVFSLTAPALNSIDRPAAPPNPAANPTGAESSNVAPAVILARGFGVPLWVMLLSVVGAAVFTILLVVAYIRKPVDFANVDDVQAKFEEVVKHQVYILFAPIGAIIVYQLLVAAGSASQAITVALAALASGLTLNLLLDKALKTVQSLLK